MKFKIVGILNLIFGLIELVYPAFILIFTLPKLKRLYSEFNANVPSFFITYLVLISIMILGAANIFVGFNLTFKSVKKGNYLFIGLIFLIVGLLIDGILISVFQTTMIVPFVPY